MTGATISVQFVPRTAGTTVTKAGSLSMAPAAEPQFYVDLTSTDTAANDPQLVDVYATATIGATVYRPSAFFRLLQSTGVPPAPPAGSVFVSSVNGETGDVVLDATDVGAAPAVHTHAISDVTGLQTALDGKAPTTHTHAISDVTALQTALDGKAATVHAHAISDVTGLQTALDGKAASSHTHVTGDISGLGTMATLGSAASGDLSGTWPSPVVHKIHGVNTQSGTPTDGDLWQYHLANTRWRHRTFVQVLSDNGIVWDGTTFAVDAIATDSITFPTFGESITNPVNGRIDFTPDPSGIGAWKLYVDMTSFNVGVRLGVIRTSNNAMNPDGSYIVFDTTAQIATDKSLSIHSADWMQLRGTSTGNDTAQLCVRSNFSGSSGAFALIDLTQLGTATRSPATAHVDPTFYVYSNDITEANDFVRMSHNQTDGLIESGNGDLRLVASGEIKVNGSPVSTKAFAVAMAVAL